MSAPFRPLFAIGLAGVPALMLFLVARAAPLATNERDRPTQPAPPPGSLITLTVRYSDTRREVSIYTPSTYISGTATPLVFALHGASGDASVMFADNKRIVAHAESDGFIAVFPNGLPKPDRPHSQNFYWSDTVNLGYMNFLMDELSARYSVDVGRIYFVGFSGGAHLIYRLAGDPAISSRIAGVGTVAGEIGSKLTEPYTSTWEIDDPSVTGGLPMPAILVQGVRDRRLPIAGGFDDEGEKIVVGFETKIALWQHFTGALTSTPYSGGALPSSVIARQWLNPTTGHAVVALEDHQLAHRWPAWDLMAEFWSFFQSMPTR